MELPQVIEKVLPAFERYYTVKKVSDPPFCAQAEFRSHNEQYFLVRSAHIADIDSNEFVYFATIENLDTHALEELTKLAWEKGLSLVKPHSGHRNSDVTLIIIAEKVDDKAKEAIRKTKLYKSYKFSFWGWSNFKLAVVEVGNGNGIENQTEKHGIYYNRFGKDYRKLLEKNIFCLKSF